MRSQKACSTPVWPRGSHQPNCMHAPAWSRLEAAYARGTRHSWSVPCASKWHLPCTGSRNLGGRGPNPQRQTYRIWDWGREGRECTLIKRWPACRQDEQPPCTTPADADGLEINIVANTPAFVLRTSRSSDQRVPSPHPQTDRKFGWSSKAKCNANPCWKKGDTVFFPANRDVAIEVGAGSHWVHCHLPFGQERFA